MDLLFLVAPLVVGLSTVSGTLDPSVLVQLESVFGSMLMSALQLVDRREVVHVSLPTGRSLYQVSSATGQPYTINLALAPPSMQSAPAEQEAGHVEALALGLRGMYCPCPGFAYNSLAGDKNLFCKHLLAVVLAHELKREVHTTVPLPAVAGLLGL